jgi:hypothetical protein
MLFFFFLILKTYASSYTITSNIITLNVLTEPVAAAPTITLTPGAVTARTKSY